MSKQEFEQQDQQVIDVVNKHAAPEAIEQAEEIAEKSLWQKVEARARKQYIAKKVAALVACAAVAAALVAVMLQPDLLIWLVNFGLLSCTAVTAVVLDRWCKRR